MTRKAAAADIEAPAAPAHYVWGFPGAPLTVHLDLRVVERLREGLGGNWSAGGQGLLFGGAAGTVTEILDFEPAADADLRAAAHAPPHRRHDKLTGFYRVESGESFRLSESDRSLLETGFVEPHQVLLLIQANSFGPPNATFFFHDGGSVSSIALLEFPFDESVLAEEQRQRLNRRQPGVATVPALPTPPAWPPRRPLSRTLLPLLGALAIIAGILITGRLLLDRARVLWTGLRAGPENAQPRAQSPPFLGLQAKRQNGDLELTWNHESPIIAAADSGVLSIKDGEQTTEIPLDSAQVRRGRALYAPVSDRIQIELDVNTSGISYSESVLVLVPASGQPRTQQADPTKVSAAPEPATEVDLPVQKSLKPFALPSSPRSSPRAAMPSDTPPAAGMTPGRASLPRVLEQAPALPPPVPASSAQPQPPESRTEAPALIPAVAISQVRPQVPSQIRWALTKPVTVPVRVTIDTQGKVTKAEVTAAGIDGSLIRAARAAAFSWKFRPARRGSDPVESELVLRFVFK